MYINLNGIALVLQLAALSGLIALGARLFTWRRRQHGYIVIRQRNRRLNKRARHSADQADN